MCEHKNIYHSMLVSCFSFSNASWLQLVNTILHNGWKIYFCRTKNRSQTRSTIILGRKISGINIRWKTYRLVWKFLDSIFQVQDKYESSTSKFYYYHFARCVSIQKPLNLRRSVCGSISASSCATQKRRWGKSNLTYPRIFHIWGGSLGRRGPSWNLWSMRKQKMLTKWSTTC